VDQAISHQITDIIDDKYLNALPDNIVGYKIVASLEILNHSNNNHGMIDPTEPLANYGYINAPFDPKIPIEDLYKQIQDYAMYTHESNHPYGDNQGVIITYTLCLNSGVLQYASKSFQERDEADKSWGFQDSLYQGTAFFSTYQPHCLDRRLPRRPHFFIVRPRS
jgi:hypothetical protein